MVNIHEKVATLFENLGISSDSVVMLHGDAGALLSLIQDTEDLPKCVDAILDYFERDGTVIVPTFTYSATKGECFDSRLTPSTIGKFSEMFRVNKRMKRTNHPIFSVSVYGKKSDQVLNANIHDAFGEESFFYMIYRENADLVTIGCSINSLTFTHFVEQKFEVPYRFWKAFPALIQDVDRRVSFETNYYVRNLDYGVNTAIDLSRFRIRALGMGSLRTTSLGRFECAAVKSSECFAIMHDMLRENNLSLIKGGTL
jgi:aminoglycoside 3-N-acetyltransferase